MTHAAELDRIIEQVVEPSAAQLDRDGAFPAAAIKELSAAGILAITVPEEFGGAGLGVGEASDVVRRLSRACGSTAMVVCMHYSATAALVAAGRPDALREIAAGQHLSTLAFSEAGSRSHFWAPLGTAIAEADGVRLDAHKSWVTSAHAAQSYVWSSKPLAAAGPMSLWFVRPGDPGLTVADGFDGLGMRGNDSCAVEAVDLRVVAGDLLDIDGAGFDFALAHVLPVFLILNASASVGLAESVVVQTAAHMSTTRLEHLDEALSASPLARHRLAEMQLHTDRTARLLDATVAAVIAGRDESQLLVLEVKAAADETAAVVSDLGMQACGGAAFRREVGVERRFRDSRAARVMAPTSDVLHDFVGRALCGLPLMDGPA